MTLWWLDHPLASWQLPLLDEQDRSPTSSPLRGWAGAVLASSTWITLRYVITRDYVTLRYVTVPGGRLRVTQQPCLQVSIMIILGLAQAASRLRPGASRLPKVAPQYISHSLREHPRLEQLGQHVGTEAADVRLELAW